MSREHGDIPCGGIPSTRELRQIGAPYKLIQCLIVIQNMENENIFMVDLPPIDNTRARISYMMNYIDVYFLKIFYRDKKNIGKKLEKCQIYMKL